MGLKTRLALLTILLVSAMLRFSGINSGLPSETKRLATFHPDESFTFSSLENMRPDKLDFYPGGSVSWGTFLLYSQGALIKAMQLTGQVKIGNRDFMIANLQEVDKLYLAGRAMVAFFSVAGVFVFFLIARKLLSNEAALFSTFIFASIPIVSWTSSLLRPDSFMLFWGMLSFYYSILAAEKGFASRRNFILAGLFAGLSIVSKYTGLVFTLPVILAWVLSLRSKKEALRYFPLLLLSAAAAWAVFLIINPYFIIRNSDVMQIMRATAQRANFPGDFLTGYAGYLKYVLSAAVGWPLLLLSVPGIYFLCTKRTASALIAVILPVCYFLRFAASHYQLLPYTLPLAPYIALAAGAAAEMMNKRLIGRVILLSVAVYTFSYAVYIQSFFITGNTHSMADAWIADNIPAGASVAISKNDSWTPPILRQYNPPYKVIAGRNSQTYLTEAIAALPGAARHSDYLLLTEAEYVQAGQDLLLGNPVSTKALADLRKDFSEIKSFKKNYNAFFRQSSRDLEVCQYRFMSPAIYILQRTVPPKKVV